MEVGSFDACRNVDSRLVTLELLKRIGVTDGVERVARRVGNKIDDSDVVSETGHMVLPDSSEK